MRSITALSLILAVVAVVPAGARVASAGGAAATAAPAGSLSIGDGTVVPPFPKTGRWTDLGTKSSDRYEIRHFIYMVPSESPAIELYVTTDRKNEPPDGVFEIGLVIGFLRGFASKAGLHYEEPVFAARDVGAAKVRHTLVKLSDGRRILWVHAYIYTEKPSLTFIAIRAQDAAQESIEKYLAGVELK